MLIYDVETTGLSWAGDYICQFSCLILSRGRITPYNQFFAVPVMGGGAESVHGMSKDWLYVASDGKTFADFAGEIRKIVTKRNKLHVGHNLVFDQDFIARSLGKTFYQGTNRKRRWWWYPDHTLNYCTMHNTTDFCGIGWSDYHESYKWPKLTELTRVLGISHTTILAWANSLFGEVRGAHDSRYDVAAVYLALQALAALNDKDIYIHERAKRILEYPIPEVMSDKKEDGEEELPF